LNTLASRVDVGTAVAEGAAKEIKKIKVGQGGGGGSSLPVVCGVINM
jgi:hypothetical protein